MPEGPRRRLAGWLVAVACACLPWLGRGAYLDESPTPEVALGRLILAVLFLAALALADAPPRRDPALHWLLALLAVGLVSTLASRSAALPGLEFLRCPADLEAAVRELARLGLVLSAGAAAARTRPAMALGGLAAGGLWTALLALRQYLQQARLGDTGFRAMVGFVSPNQLASYLLVLLPLMVAFIAAPRDDSPAVRWLEARQVDRPAAKLRLAAALAALLVLVAIYLTGSRGAVLGLLAASLATAAGLARRGRARAALPVLGLLVLLGGLLLLGPMRTRLVAAANQQNSQLFRLLTWQGTLEMAAAMPLLGCGPGGWAYAYPPFARAAFTLHAHNGFLQTAAECGLPGLIALLGLFVVWLRAGWRGAADDDPSRRAFGIAQMAACAGLAGIGAFDSGWYIPAVAGAMTVLSAALAPPIEAPSERRLPWLAGGLVLLLVMICDARAESLRAQSALRLRGGAFATASALCREARTAAPWSVAAVEQLAGIQAAVREREAAEATYRELIARRTWSGRARYRLAALYQADGRLDEAMAEAELGVKLSPMHLQGYLQLGRLYEEAGQSAEARRTYEDLDRLANTRALREAAPIQKRDYLFEPTQAYALMRLAPLAATAGDEAQAHDAWERAAVDLRQYLKTYDQQAALLRDVSAADQRAILALQGLYPEERDEAEALLNEALERLAATSPRPD